MTPSELPSWVALLLLSVPTAAAATAALGATMDAFTWTLAAT